MNRVPSALVALFLLTAPALALAPPAAPQSFIVAFSAMPDGLVPGGDLHGARVERVNPTLRYAVVDAAHPEEFARRVLADASIASFAADAAEAREAALPQAWVDSTSRGQHPPLHFEMPGFATPFAPNDPYYAAQYAAPQVRADLVWPHQREAQGVALCVLDSGVRASHEELAGPRWRGGYDFVERDADPQDERYHGTFVTSVAAGTMDNGRGFAGLAQVNFYHGRVLDGQGSGKWSDIADGIQWCADLPEPHVIISMSFSGRSTGTGRDITHEAVKYAASKGALLVGSAGNENGRRPFCLDCVNFPASFPEVIAVTGTSRGELPAWWSSFGPEAEISAPADWVQGATHKSDQAYTVFSGTSFAAPLVSGAAALAWSAHPDLSAPQLRERLAATSQDLGAPGRDIHYGHGELDLRCLMAGISPCDGRS